MASPRAFPFVQLEFPFALGPASGRYVVRSRPDAEARRVIVLGTERVPRGRRRSRRRLRTTESAELPTVSIARATVIGAAPLRTHEDARAWLGALRSDETALDAELGDAVGELNGLLRAHRAASADPHARDVSLDRALDVRVGYGAGELVSEGRFDAALEVEGAARRLARTDLLAPQERTASILAGREEVPPSEELLLRARADLEAHRPREGALQARVALECLLAELAGSSDPGLAELESARTSVSEAANAALGSEPAPELLARVCDAVELMAGAVRRRALRPR